MKTREYTDIVEVPVVYTGVEFLDSPEMRSLPVETLRLFAKAYGGEVVWQKMRVTYSPLETQLCCRKECFRPVNPGQRECDSHPVPVR